MRIQRVLSLLVGAAALLSTTALAAPASAAPAPPTTDIIDGGPASYAPFAVRLFSNGTPWCSASIIAPSWVLTAQHCVSDDNATYTFRIGSLQQDSGGTLVTGVEVVDHPSADLALVRINQAQPSWWEYARLGTPSAVAANQAVQIWGWGATCLGDEGSCQSPVLKMANTLVESVSASDWLGGVAISSTRVDGISAGGDSGGPMMATSPVDGLYYQVGVSSTSNRYDWCAYTNITVYRDWIFSVAGV
jgi:secreted trypsin-like serine protease